LGAIASQNENIALQQFEFYTQAIACQELFSATAILIDVSHKM
jgi:hypothetical protein